MIKIIYSLLVFGVLQVRVNKINFIWCGLILVTVFIGGLLFNTPLYENFKIVRNRSLLDTVSISLILLRLFLLVLIYLASFQSFNLNYYMAVYGTLIYFLTGVLLISFLVGNYLYFYFFFEVRLIPTLYIIIGWGYQPERLQAGIYLIVYTLFISLPLLIGLVYLNCNLLDLGIWNSLSVSYFMNDLRVIRYLIVGVIIIAFLVKLPIFLMHLWLPKAHVEAPVAGSMILAGVLLKLGGFGVIRMFWKFSFFVVKINYIFIGLSLTGMVFIGLVCCRLNDLKALVAYSSVAHIGGVIRGVFTGLVFGLSGGLLIIVSHGLSSSGLFCFVNVLYERRGRRSIFINKGLINVLPWFSLLFFLLCCANISAPPSINLLSEAILLISINGYDILNMVFFAPGVFLGAVFTFYILSLSSHGRIFRGRVSFLGGHVIELHVLFIHLLPVNLLLLKNELFLSL